MNADYKIAAAVMIGGRSSRMGRPKEDIVIPGDGRTFLDRICDEVDKCFGECLCGRYLSVRKGQKKLREGYTIVEDSYEETGPLGGLVSVLEQAALDGYDAVLLLACDMIFYTESEIINICDRYNGQDILFARTDGRYIQPLASIYGVNMLESAISLAGSGDFRLRKLADHSENAAYYDSENLKAYSNLNTDAELSTLL